MGYRYIGSKDKLSKIIISEIRNIDQNANSIIDLMAGTGLFSLALRENGYTVIANDVMTYSYHHLNFHLRLDKEPNFDKIPKELIINSNNNYSGVLEYLNSLKGIKGYFYNEFSPEGKPENASKSRKYFTAENASKIDAIRKEIKALKENELISDLEHSLLLHDLIMASNDIANIAGTYGHYLSKFVKRAKTPIHLYPSNFSSIGKVDDHLIYQDYAENVASQISGDFCYIDPPYIKRQYAANYHILETIAREDEPTAVGESGLRPWRDQYSNFCSKVKIRDSFDRIFTKIDCKNFIISYSEDGLIPIDDLIEFLNNYGRVSKKDIEYKRFKSNGSKKSSTLHEYLIHLNLN